MRKLSDAEKHCWEYLQHNLSKIPNLTIQKISQEAHVSLSTVTRTVKKMGYDGYIDFKQSLKHNKGEKRKNGFSKEVNNAIRKNEIEISRTINQLSAEDIEQAVKMIDRQEQILLFSAGLSRSVAWEMQRKLSVMGKIVFSYDDFDDMKFYANRAGRKTLVVAFSISGDTPEIAESLRIARGKKAKAIAITASIFSSIAEQADVKISAYKSGSKEYNFGLDVSSRLPLQVVNRILLDAYAIYKNLEAIRD